jgi:hypothetical protein
MAKTKAAVADQEAEAPADGPVVVVAKFLGVVDGAVYPQEFDVGAEIHGDLAEVALREGWAERKGA